jgi:Aldo/keto reductase family
MMRTTRREFAVLGTAALVARPASAQDNAASPIARAIPRTEERIPAVGLGTAYVFDRENQQTQNAATEVVRTLIESGGQLIDTASTYGDAESVLGNVIAREGTREKLFIATKLEAPDAAELKRSLSRLDGETRPAPAPQRAQSAAIVGTVQSMEGARHLPVYWGDLDVSWRFRRHGIGDRARAAGFRADRLFPR